MELIEESFLKDCETEKERLNGKMEKYLKETGKKV
jgi:hypothetical protein